MDYQSISSLLPEEDVLSRSLAQLEGRLRELKTRNPSAAASSSSASSSLISNSARMAQAGARDIQTSRQDKIRLEQELADLRNREQSMNLPVSSSSSSRNQQQEQQDYSSAPQASASSSSFQYYPEQTPQQIAMDAAILSEPVSSPHFRRHSLQSRSRSPSPVNRRQQTTAPAAPVVSVPSFSSQNRIPTSPPRVYNFEIASFAAVQSSSDNPIDALRAQVERLKSEVAQLKSAEERLMSHSAATLSRPYIPADAPRTPPPSQPQLKNLSYTDAMFVESDRLEDEIYRAKFNYQQQQKQRRSSSVLYPEDEELSSALYASSSSSFSSPRKPSQSQQQQQQQQKPVFSVLSPDRLPTLFPNAYNAQMQQDQWKKQQQVEKEEEASEFESRHRSQRLYSIAARQSEMEAKPRDLWSDEEVIESMRLEKEKLQLELKDFSRTEAAIWHSYGRASQSSQSPRSKPISFAHFLQEDAEEYRPIPAPVPIPRLPIDKRPALPLLEEEQEEEEEEEEENHFYQFAPKYQSAPVSARSSAPSSRQPTPRVIEQQQPQQQQSQQQPQQEEKRSAPMSSEEIKAQIAEIRARRSSAASASTPSSAPTSARGPRTIPILPPSSASSASVPVESPVPSSSSSSSESSSLFNLLGEPKVPSSASSFPAPERNNNNIFPDAAIPSSEPVQNIGNQNGGEAKEIAGIVLSLSPSPAESSNHSPDLIQQLSISEEIVPGDDFLSSPVLHRSAPPQPQPQPEQQQQQQQQLESSHERAASISPNASPIHPSLPSEQPQPQSVSQPESESGSSSAGLVIGSPKEIYSSGSQASTPRVVSHQEENEFIEFESPSPSPVFLQANQQQEQEEMLRPPSASSDDDYVQFEEEEEDDDIELEVVSLAAEAAEEERSRPVIPVLATAAAAAVVQAELAAPAPQASHAHVHFSSRDEVEVFRPLDSPATVIRSPRDVSASLSSSSASKAQQSPRKPSLLAPSVHVPVVAPVPATVPIAPVPILPVMAYSREALLAPFRAPSPPHAASSSHAFTSPSLPAASSSSSAPVLSPVSTLSPRNRILNPMEYADSSVVLPSHSNSLTSLTPLLTEQIIQSSKIAQQQLAVAAAAAAASSSSSSIAEPSPRDDISVASSSSPLSSRLELEDLDEIIPLAAPSSLSSSRNEKQTPASPAQQSQPQPQLAPSSLPEIKDMEKKSSISSPAPALVAPAPSTPAASAAPSALPKSEAVAVPAPVIASPILVEEKQSVVIETKPEPTKQEQPIPTIEEQKPISIAAVLEEKKPESKPVVVAAVAAAKPVIEEKNEQKPVSAQESTPIVAAPVVEEKKEEKKPVIIVAAQEPQPVIIAHVAEEKNKSEVQLEVVVDNKPEIVQEKKSETNPIVVAVVADAVAAPKTVIETEPVMEEKVAVPEPKKEEKKPVVVEVTRQPESVPVQESVVQVTKEQSEAKKDNSVFVQQLTQPLAAASSETPLASSPSVVSAPTPAASSSLASSAPIIPPAAVAGPSSSVPQSSPLSSVVSDPLSSKKAEEKPVAAAAVAKPSDILSSFDQESPSSPTAKRRPVSLLSTSPPPPPPPPVPAVLPSIPSSAPSLPPPPPPVPSSAPPSLPASFQQRSSVLSSKSAMSDELEELIPASSAAAASSSSSSSHQPLSLSSGPSLNPLPPVRSGISSRPTLDEDDSGSSPEIPSLPDAESSKPEESVNGDQQQDQQQPQAEAEALSPEFLAAVEQQGQAIDQAIRRGDFMVKFPRSGKPALRFIFVRGEGPSKAALCWAEREGKKESDSVLLSEVSQMLFGAQTSTFEKHRRPNGLINGPPGVEPHDGSLCFSLITKTRTVDLLCSNTAQLQGFAMGLMAYIPTLAEYGRATLTQAVLQQYQQLQAMQEAALLEGAGSSGIAGIESSSAGNSGGDEIQAFDDSAASRQELSHIEQQQSGARRQGW